MTKNLRGSHVLEDSDTFEMQEVNVQFKVPAIPGRPSSFTMSTFFAKQRHLPSVGFCLTRSLGLPCALSILTIALSPAPSPRFLPRAFCLSPRYNNVFSEASW